MSTILDTCSKRIKSAEGIIRCPGAPYAKSVADGHVSYRCQAHYEKHLASEWVEWIYYEVIR